MRCGGTVLGWRRSRRRRSSWCVVVRRGRGRRRRAVVGAIGGLVGGARRRCARWWPARWTWSRRPGRRRGGGAAAVASGERPGRPAPARRRRGGRAATHLTSGTSAASSSGASDIDASGVRWLRSRYTSRSPMMTGHACCVHSQSLVSIVAVPNCAASCASTCEPRAAHAVAARADARRDRAQVAGQALRHVGVLRRGVAEDHDVRGEVAELGQRRGHPVAPQVVADAAARRGVVVAGEDDQVRAGGGDLGQRLVAPRGALAVGLGVAQRLLRRRAALLREVQQPPVVGGGDRLQRAGTSGRRGSRRGWPPSPAESGLP